MPLKSLLRTSLTVIVVLLTAWAQGAEATGTARRPRFATTVDFLDYAFFDREGGKEIYPLEVYERRLKEVADAGVSKVYLRVNCLGLTLYPTGVAAFYGENNQFHWNFEEWARRLMRTIRTYDVCKETIRICHKYGMEAWCWESVCDGSGNKYSLADLDDKFRPWFEKCDGAPFRDPFYLAHPECYSWRDPKLMLSREEFADANRDAMRGTVARILVVDTAATGTPPRIKPDEVEIYVSDDNQAYVPYDGRFQSRMYVDERGCGTVEITGLAITQKYVKLAHPAYTDSSWGVGLRDARGACKAFADDGRELCTTWATLYDEKATKEGGAFNFVTFFPAGWDYRHYQIGFMRGMVDEEEMRYFPGIYEFCDRQAMEHQLARFAELAAYPFDGYMLNFRTHVWRHHPEEYGYNPEVREIYLQRHGVDIWKEEADLGKLNQIRAEGIAEYFSGCKRLIGERPLFITGFQPMPPGERRPKCGKLGADATQVACHGMGMEAFGYLPWLYRRYLAEDKSVDGIMMTDAFFPEFFTPEVTGGRKIAIGLYRERPTDGSAYDFNTYDFAKDMERLVANPAIDEIELYETINYTHPENRPPRLPVLKALTSADGRKDTADCGKADLARLQAHLRRPRDRAYALGGEKSRFTWVFLGDSITSGVVHTHGARSFTEIFRNRVCGEIGLLLDTVINSGFSGLDTKAILERGLYESHVRPYHPDAVVIMLGMNDARGVSQITVEQFRSNIARLVDMARADGAIPVLMTCNTIEKYVSPDGGPLNAYFLTYLKAYEALPAYMEAVRDVAREKDVVLVDNFAHWEKDAADPAVLASWLGETIHPGAKGHLEIASEIFRVLGISAPNGNSMAARSVQAGRRTDRP